MLSRKHDIQELGSEQLTIKINGQPVAAAHGETVLSVLNAVGMRQLARNDSQQVMGSYCGMGVCHCCQVKIDGRYKRRACQTIVQADMLVETAVNRIELEGLQ
ncbi:2Fe-2S iron-sulfur cluster-binding protein [Janthinobacterium fluminis]|uniref:2Fe-2S iron-sulfur cluster-binding protein n=1 Tax=Janthinobacterium fluminis TaxID=2987524 RepID=A0ABT5JVT4_9BURK|nr:2Fe-2S iron-sulfur cluster-binding protein [Janthinobacterium fluminis]MDC8756834.1 2Fe-2S iron-sulfur cluster-binding protein [Janthinobacterium fluminis]